MKTTPENFEAAKAEVLSMISAAPDFEEGMDDNWETVTLDNTELKKEIMAAVPAASQFTPAFTPRQNVKMAVKLSSKAYNFLDNTVPN